MTTDGNELPLQFPTAGSCIVLQVRLCPKDIFLPAGRHNFCNLFTPSFNSHQLHGKLLPRQAVVVKTVTLQVIG